VLLFHGVLAFPINIFKPWAGNSAAGVAFAGDNATAEAFPSPSL
jgi:hypothetical protein